MLPATRLRLQSAFTRWFPLASLYLLQLAILAAFVRAAGAQHVLTKEEASAGFVSPLFLSFHLQHHLYATNFYSYVIFQFGHAVFPGLFGVRESKALIMAALPALLFLILRDRLAVTPVIAFFASLAAGLAPGLLGFSWLATEYGLESVFGLLALWLAFDERAAAMPGSAALAAVSAGMYGPGLAFLGAVMAIHLLRFRVPALRIRAAASLLAALLTLLVPVFWCHNLQTLFLGGGGKPSLRSAAPRVLALLGEVFSASGSYYAFLNGRAAAGPWLVAALAAAGALVAAVRFRRAALALAVIAAVTLLLTALAPQVPGVRRAIPLVAVLSLCAGLAIHWLWRSRLPAIRLSAICLLAAWLAVSFTSAWGLCRDLRFSAIALPHDFTFSIPPGSDMESAVAAFVALREPWPADWTGYEPDRTLAILYVLSSPHAPLSGSELICICETRGYALPANLRRFDWLRRRL